MLEGDLLMPTLIALFHTACVMMVVAYLLTRLRKIALFKETNWQQQFVLTVIFGLFSLYATRTAIELQDSLISLRIAGPIIGGLVAGPWVGIGAGFIGMVERLLQGGETAVSGAWLTIASGLLAGSYSRFLKGQRGMNAFVFTFCTTVVAALFTKLLTPNVPSFGLILLIISNTLAVTFFIFFLNNVAEEQDIRSAKEVIENELQIARDIQLSIVPRTFPPFPQVDRCDLFALLEPAKEVGGDLYDFFFIDDKRIFFAIGDVAGKGVPSALMMAVTRTLLKAKMERDSDIAETLRQVNNDLCNGNDMVMFVTAFCGVLDVDTGQLEYCNAGHNPPFILRQSAQVEKVPLTQGVAFGVVRDIDYIKGQVVLKPGDVIVTYTDGVTEASNLKDELYGVEGLEKCLHQVDSYEPEGIVKSIFQDVREFAAGASQSDDITLLVLRYKGKPKISGK